MSEQSYLVTARKYRPQLFGDIVSQEHVSETLKNAIRLDRLAHAYMFTGPRGVGKTTAARILAKAINCTTPLEERVDQAEPCRTCASCKSFEEGRNLNIIEIDAASNNKVDDARDLRDTVRIPPQGAKMKVYIIDEVHMLTTQAFNALLKTLEEPPPFVSFIFATTEPQKVLPTIQSRCQRFDFRRIAISEIVSRLQHVCKEEHVSADDASLMLIARKGDGALRDALSVFDQAVSLCGTDLVYEDLIKALGVVDSDLYFAVTRAAHGNDVARMIRIVEQIVQSGYDLQEFLDGLAEHLRNLLVIKSVGDRSLIEATEEDQKKYEEEAGRFSESVLLRFVHIVGETSDSLRNARQPRLRLEMALFKIASLPSAVDIRTALDKIEKLEALAVRSPGALKESVGEKTMEKTNEVLPEPPGESEVTRPSSEPEEPAEVESTSFDLESADTPSSEPPTSPGDDEPVPDKTASIEVSVTPSPASAETLTEESSARPADPAPGPAQTGTLDLPFDAPALKKPRTLPENQTNSVIGQVEEEGDVAVLVEEAPDDTDNEVAEAWRQLVAQTMESQIRLGSLLRHTQVISAKGGSIRVGVPDTFHEKMLRSERTRFLKALESMVGVEVSDLHFEISDRVRTESESSTGESFNARAFLQTKCEENPAVQSLLERFGGEIVW